MMWKYKIGEVVRHGKETALNMLDEETDLPLWGHIVGFDQNSLGECILEIKWQDGSVKSIHASNVEIRV